MLIVLSSPFLRAQRTIQGIVTDQRENPLPFVNVLINDSQTRGVSTDIDGRFRIELTDAIYALTFRYVGYETKRIAIGGVSDDLVVRLRSSAYGLEEVVVVAGENPADIVIRRAVANRERNHPENLDSYQCRTYNKLVFSFAPDQEGFESFFADKDTSKKLTRRYYHNTRRMMEKSEEHHLFIMETVTRRNYRAPGQTREVVLHNRASGFTEAPFAALANDVQPFAFYDEELDMLDKTFLNPISRGSTDKYFFHLRDSLYQGQDTIFVIEFHPRRGKNFEGLTGVLYIHSRGYAVQNVIAEPADTSFIQLRIEQQYALIDDRQWFPEQLNFVLHARRYPSPFMGMRIYGKSYVDEALINPRLPDETFKSAEQVIFSPKADQYSDSLWRTHRREPLDSLEQNTYIVLDTLGERLQLDKRLRQVEALATGRWPLGPVDLFLPDVLAFNNFEGTRLGLGLYTNDRLFRWFSLGGYAGYGFSDGAWKYGGSLELNLERNSETTLTAYYRQDILEPAVPGFELSRQAISRRFLARRMDRVEGRGLALSSRPLKYLEVQARLRHQRIRPFGEYRYRKVEENGEAPVYRFSEASVGFRYAFGEQYLRFMGGRLPQATPHPVLEAHYIQGFPGWLGGAFRYRQALLAVEQTFSVRNFGETRYRLETGWLDRSTPLAKLYNSSGFGRDFQFLTIGHAFQTMDRYEFLSDRFLHLFFEHDFGTLLFKTGEFKPGLSLVHNLALGDLRHPERQEGLDFKTLEQGYYEGGMVVENLIRLNYVNLLYLGLGAGAYYRYGPYSLDQFADNWAFRLAITFSY